MQHEPESEALESDHSAITKSQISGTLLSACGHFFYFYHHSLNMMKNELCGSMLKDFLHCLMYNICSICVCFLGRSTVYNCLAFTDSFKTCLTILRRTLYFSEGKIL